MGTIRESETRGVEAARSQLPAILDAAAAGRTTLITRRGRAVAAVVPVAQAAVAKPASLLALTGSGRGLWGEDSRATLAQLREEWDR